MMLVASFFLLLRQENEWIEWVNQLSNTSPWSVLYEKERAETTPDMTCYYLSLLPTYLIDSHVAVSMISDTIDSSVSQGSHARSIAVETHCPRRRPIRRHGVVDYQESCVWTIGRINLELNWEIMWATTTTPHESVLGKKGLLNVWKAINYSSKAELIHLPAATWFHVCLSRMDISAPTGARDDATVRCSDVTCTNERMLVCTYHLSKNDQYSKWWRRLVCVCDSSVSVVPLVSLTLLDTQNNSHRPSQPQIQPHQPPSWEQLPS